MSDQKPRRPHIVACTPTRGEMQHGFAFDLANLIGYTAGVLGPKGLDLGLLFMVGTYIDQNRCDLAEEALKNPATTHVLFLDDDMRFPRTAVAQLLQHRKSVVGINYAHRIHPITPVAIKQGTEKLVTGPDSTGLEQVAAIGFGCLLIERTVFNVIPYPWFESYFHPTEKRWIGEDVQFAAHCLDAKIPIYVDHDLSKECGHTGKHDFRLWDTPQWEKAPSVTEPEADRPVLVP